MAHDIPAGEPYRGDATSARFALVCSRFNARYTRALLDHAVAELQVLAPGAPFDVFETPGSYEIPLMAQSVLRKRDYTAVLCFGLIFQGATRHADLIAGAITQGLMQVGLEAGRPVVHEILMVADEAQAEERCFGQRINRGIEAARAAVTMANALHDLAESE